MLCAQAVLEPGDHVLLPSPHWPHLCEIPRILGARSTTVDFGLSDVRWTLDLERFCAEVTDKTRLVILKSPSNPTGWTLTHEEQLRMLNRCRKTGSWILADEVYNRIFYEGGRAPSFLDIAQPDDRVLVVNSFSKSWAMTGWRLGWVVMPSALAETFANLNEYNVSSPPVFVQSAGIAAIEQGAPFSKQLFIATDRCGTFASLSSDRSRGSRCLFQPERCMPFFRVDGVSDSLALAKNILLEARVGLAPGSAFGPYGEGRLRLCFAGTRERLKQPSERLVEYFSRFENH